MRKGHNSEEYMTPNQVAERLLVSPVTVRQWAQKGLLKAETTPGGHRRFARSEVERFARERGVVDEKAAAKILVVDDSPPFTEYLAKLLKKLPYPVDVTIAHDGFDAGRKVAALVPDVVLMDIKMPGMDGYAVCEQLKSDPRTRHIRVIAMTGYYTPESAKRVMAAGAEACLSKPFDNQVLLELIGLEGIQSASKS